MLLVFDAQGGVAWTSEGEKVFIPTMSGSMEAMIVTVPRGGVYTVALQDAVSTHQIQAAEVQVEVLGEDFDL